MNVSKCETVLRARRPADERIQALEAQIEALTGEAPKQGRMVLVPQAGRAPGAITEDALMAHVRSNSGRRGEQVATAFGTGTASVRPLTRRLIKAGRVKTAGRARAMSYAVL